MTEFAPGSVMLQPGYFPEIEGGFPAQSVASEQRSVSDLEAQFELDQLESLYAQPAYGAEVGYVALAVETETPTPELELTNEQLEAARLEKLYALPSVGFENKADVYRQTIQQVAATGFPVYNFRQLTRRDNIKGTRSEYTLGSWGIGAEDYGDFSTYELLDKQIPEERLATNVHESAHANTPLLEANAHLFGGEAKREEAAELVKAVTEQSLMTGKWLDGYHKFLSEQYSTGEITYELFQEETSAILSELAIVNRARVEEIQAQQHLAWDDLARIQRIHGGAPLPPKVNLISYKDRKGTMITDGIDKTLISLLEGINSHDQLIHHVDNLKKRFYGEDTYKVAEERHAAQNGESIARYNLFLQLMAEVTMRQEIDAEQSRNDRAKRDKRSKKSDSVIV